ncbi:MAG: phytoene desaturase family protein [Phycisphaerales bacterium]
MSTPSIAIVGAGPGGLAAAILLASSGLRVTIYEACDQVGGRSGQLVRDGFRFDRGPTFFMMPYVLDEILAAAGRRLGDLVELRRLDPMYRLLVGQPMREPRSAGTIELDRSGAPVDGRDATPNAASPITIDAVQDIDRMAAQLERVRRGDGDGFRRFMRDNRTKLRLMTPILRSPMRSMLDLATADALRVGPWLKPWQSLHDHLGGYFRDDSVRLAMSFQSKYLGMSPFECPSLFSILPFIEYEYGIWHPIGGCHALMRAMAGVAEELGVDIRCGEPVTALRFAGRRVTGVCADGAWRDHDHVVINADATWAMKTLIPESLRGRATDAAIDARDYSCSTFMMYLGVRGEIDLPHHTIYTSASYRSNLADIGEGRLGDDPSFYVCNPSRLDGSLAPPGCSSLYVLVPTPNTKAPIDWRSARDRLRRDAYGQMARVLGLRDLAERVVSETTFTPDDWRAMNINHGATFNLSHSLSQMLHRRPQHRLPGLDGVWLVGGGTHPGSGLPVIFLSSQITARLLCDEVGATGAAVPADDRFAA